MGKTFCLSKCKWFGNQRLNVCKNIFKKTESFINNIQPFAETLQTVTVHNNTCCEEQDYETTRMLPVQWCKQQ